MSPFRSPSPPTLPIKFKRKSSLPSTSASIEDYMHTIVPYSSPSSSLVPLPLTRRDGCTKGQTGNYFDDLDEIAHAHQDKAQESAYPWPCSSRPEHPLPYAHRPLPSLMTKFTTRALRGDGPLAFNPSPFSSQTACCHPQGGGATADDREEYDLESMDIHIRETYFATSAERGRWLSSPIASRVRSPAIPPTRGHSSPIKSVGDPSPLRERSRRRNMNCSVDNQIYTPSSQDRDEDVPCSSSLPPSSPLTSPMSNFSFLNDDCEDNSVVDPRSSSDECHSFTGTPELSISSTSCASPIDFMRTPSPCETSVTDAAHQLTDLSCHPPRSVISRHTSPCSSKPTDLHVHASDITDFGSDVIFSPLPQFESDLPEAEPPKLPLSDTVNKPYPGQQLAVPGATVDAARVPAGPRSTQSLPVNSNCELFDAPPDTVGGLGFNKTAKERKRSAAGNVEARRSRKRAVTLSWSPSPDTKRRGETECRSSNHSEPPSKKSRSSHCRDDFKGRGAKSVLRRGRISKDKRSMRVPPTAQGCDLESARLCDRKTPKSTGHAQLQRPAPSSFITSVDAVDAEFHASLTGMLVEALATSRASSMDASALYLVLTQAHPYLAAERSKEELLMDIAVVLEAGLTRCGMFEKVDGSGETSRHKAFDSRWFYVPERDEDVERATLISAIIPRQKRNETKKYKQYYYRPLDKISRWDPEDAP